MRDTSFRVPDDRLSRLAAAYRLDNRQLSAGLPAGVEGAPAGMLSGSGGLRSTARDYFRFAQCLLNEGELGGVRLLSPKSVRLMRHDHLPGRYPSSSGDYSFGFGVQVRTRVLNGDIGTVDTFGWNGASGAVFWVDPRERMAAVLFTPFVPPAPADVYDLFERGMYRAIDISYDDGR